MKKSLITILLLVSILMLLSGCLFGPKKNLTDRCELEFNGFVCREAIVTPDTINFVFFDPMGDDDTEEGITITKLSVLSKKLKIKEGECQFTGEVYLVHNETSSLTINCKPDTIPEKRVEKGKKEFTLEIEWRSGDSTITKTGKLNTEVKPAGFSFNENAAVAQVAKFEELLKSGDINATDSLFLTNEEIKEVKLEEYIEVGHGNSPEYNKERRHQILNAIAEGGNVEVNLLSPPMSVELPDDKQRNAIPVTVMLLELTSDTYVTELEFIFLEELGVKSFIDTIDHASPAKLGKLKEHILPCNESCKEKIIMLRFTNENPVDLEELGIKSIIAMNGSNYICGGKIVDSLQYDGKEDFTHKQIVWTELKFDCDGEFEKGETYELRITTKDDILWVLLEN
ncbi:MAG: hypothetical protein GY861_12200 [bacterium]|nr:hypothetical protein [bacterium]